MSKLAVVYLSTQGSTRMMAEAIAEGAREKHIEVRVDNFYEWDPKDAATYDGIAVGSSTFYYKMLEPISKFLDQLIAEGVEGKIGAAFGSYGWSGEAPIMIAERMRESGMKVIDPVLRVQYVPNEKDLKECLRLGKDIAINIKKMTKKT
ncbi:MAG: FprA family A-type flavoprotein [Methanomethylovorans sp.]|nr:FprA family A-type flavoprotein [Methanomethylovorans sp.]